MPDSRPMSWAFGGTGPSGGRRRTPSQSPTFKRYVRLDAPEGNWLTSRSPSGTFSTCDRRYCSTALRSKSSPLRTSMVSLNFFLPGLRRRRREGLDSHAYPHVGAFLVPPLAPARSRLRRRQSRRHPSFRCRRTIVPPGAVVQFEAIHIQVGENRRRSEKVLEIEATTRARAHQVDRVRPRDFEVASHGPGVAEGSKENRVCGGHVGDGAGAVCGHEDHVLGTDHLGRVLL